MKTKKIIIKKNFIERFERLTDIDRFLEYSLKYRTRSFRVNTLKKSTVEVYKRLSKNWTLTKIPWCHNGFYIQGEGSAVGNLVEHVLGYIYIQEAASMIPPIVLQPKEHEFILDLCASPGSKTTQVAALMNNTGFIIANDSEYKRLKPLSINLQRCGVFNTIISLMDAKKIKNLACDKILLDAPCSGTGVIRKSLNTLQIYNPHMIKKISNEQKKLILNAYDNLREKGILVYSTCSLEPEENEEVIDFLLQKRDAKIMPISLQIKSSPPIEKFGKKEYSPEIKKCLRLWPQDNDTDGFFVSKIKKP